MAPFDSLKRFWTEEQVFGKNALRRGRCRGGRTDGHRGRAETGSTDQTATKISDGEQSSDCDCDDDIDVTPAGVATSTSNGH